MYFLLRFVFPALTKREKCAILFYLTAGSACFGVGVWFSYSKITPQAVAFFDVVNRVACGRACTKTGTANVNSISAMLNGLYTYFSITCGGK